MPQSDACFVKAYPRETTEAFLDGHVAAFGFFGGVPQSILYDNTKLAVAKICGDGRRERTRAFTELVSHYLFRDYCLAAASMYSMVLGPVAGLT
jgi:transposase